MTPLCLLSEPTLGPVFPTREHGPHHPLPRVQYGVYSGKTEFYETPSILQRGKGVKMIVSKRIFGVGGLDRVIQ